MTTNEKIVKAAVAAANGKVPRLPQKSGYCLMFVRLVVEWALFGGKDGEFYRRYLVAGTSGRGGTPTANLKAAQSDKWAADIEASAKKLGWPAPAILRKPGDLVFNHAAAAPVGHIGILLTRDVVLENIHPSFRPDSIHLSHSSLSITPYASRPWTLVARLPGGET